METRHLSFSIEQVGRNINFPRNCRLALGFVFFNQADDIDFWTDVGEVDAVKVKKSI